MSDMTIDWTEAESQGAVLVTGIVKYNVKGRLWQGGISGRGQDRRAAVVATVGDTKERQGFVAAIMSVLSEKYPDAVPGEARSPKVTPLPVEPARRQRPAVSIAPAKLSQESPDSTRPSLTAPKRGWPKGKPRGPRMNPGKTSHIPIGPSVGARFVPLTGDPLESKPQTETTPEPF